MPTYPLATLAPTISSAGIAIPSYSDIYQSLIASFQGIYGSDIYIAPDSQDGQWLAVLASAINDSNQAAVALFQSFSPSYAQGVELSSLVKINGLARQIATNSTAIGNAIGQAGTAITNGVVTDINGNDWALPSSVTVPIGGSIAVTVVAVESGNLAAPIGTINKISNPQYGWQSFSNTTAAVPGNPVETDFALRLRQAISTSLPAQTPKQAILASVADISGVGRYAIYENDTGTTDSNGLPPHSISVVVEGGDALAIATAIEFKKTIGCNTYGSTSETVLDPAGIPNTINFYELAYVPIYAAITITPLYGYVSTTGAALVAAFVNFINSLAIGEDVYLSWLYGPASLTGSPLGATFDITSLTIGLSSGSLSASNITIPFNEAASCVAANVALTV